MTIRNEVYRKCPKFWISPFETKDQNLRVSSAENYFIDNFKNWINSEMNIEYSDKKLWYMYMYTNVYKYFFTSIWINSDWMGFKWRHNGFCDMWKIVLFFRIKKYDTHFQAILSNVIDIHSFNVNWEKRIWSVVANKITFMYLSIH